ncbi:hypothetical protein D7V86_22785 [bacterium D16-51]|nr:hypothetical protein D7V96_22835 [bacterium D16-59]RKI54784.1 hypothetical protein D7V86_22785 [bacterium D16-51]
MFGDSALYFITFDIKEKKLTFVKILRLQDMDGIVLTEEKINGIQERFRQHIENLGDADLEVEKEKLCYLIQNEDQRISSSVDKINIYATIILTVLPLALAVIDLKAIIAFPFLLILGIVLIVYSLVNICAYVFKAIKVQGISKSTFSDLRGSQEKEKEILLQYQYDWQQLKYKAQLFVSYVLNLQEWVILILVLTVGISIGIAFQEIGDNKTPTNGVGDSKVITLNISDVEEPYNQAAVKWKELLLEIEKESCKHIVFIGNYDKVPVFFKELDKYDDLEIDFLQDSQMDKEQIKIIREER